MVVVPDLVSGINIVLCLIIVILGILIYTRKGEISALLIGIAFGLFAISHIYSVLGLGTSWEGALITARICGYILIVAALYLVLTSGNPQDDDD
jgi:uncharacterized membrane protein (UPF0136 family)